MKPNKPNNKHHNKAHDKTNPAGSITTLLNAQQISIESDPIGKTTSLGENKQ